MGKQTTDTRQFTLLPEDDYTFTVEKKPEKFRTEKSTYRKWHFSYMDEYGNRKSFRKIMFPWTSKELLLALGGVELSVDNIEWNDDDVVGKSFTAKIIHRPDNKGTMREEFDSINSLDAEEDMSIPNEPEDSFE